MVKTLGQSFQSHFQCCIKKQKKQPTSRINEVCHLILDITGRSNEAGKHTSREAETQVWKRSFTCLGIENKHLAEVRDLGNKPRKLRCSPRARWESAAEHGLPSTKGSSQKTSFALENITFKWNIQGPVSSHAQPWRVFSWRLLLIPLVFLTFKLLAPSTIPTYILFYLGHGFRASKTFFPRKSLYLTLFWYVYDLQPHSQGVCHHYSKSPGEISRSHQWNIDY